MHKQSHTAAGLIAGHVVAATLSPHDPVATIAIIIGSGVGGTMPDWDIKIPDLKHRGISHTLWPLALLFVLTWFLTQHWYIAAGVSAGYLAHLITDSMTVTGIYWFRLDELIVRSKAARKAKATGTTSGFWGFYWHTLHGIHTKGSIRTQGRKPAFYFMSYKNMSLHKWPQYLQTWSGEWDKREAKWLLIFASINVALTIWTIIRLADNL